MCTLAHTPAHTRTHTPLGGGGPSDGTYTDPISVEIGRLPEVNSQAGAALAAEHLIFLFGVEAIPKHLRLAVAVPLDVLAPWVFEVE